MQDSKWCGGCKAWEPVCNFGLDASRGDGLSTKCRASRRPNTNGPSRAERRAMRSSGMAWCKDCADWRGVTGPRWTGRCAEHERAAARRWYGERGRAGVQRRVYARKRRVAGIPDDAQANIFAATDGACAYCPSPAMGIDHVSPVSRGGLSEPGNLVPACKSCNSSKKDRDPAPWLLRMSFDALGLLLVRPGRVAEMLGAI